MSLDIFEKGESIPRTVELSDDNENILNTAIFLTIEVVVFSSLHDVIGTYTLADGDVDLLAPTTDGQIFFVVPATVTATTRALKYFYRITTTETNTDYPTGVRTRSFLGWCFELKVTQ